MIWIDWKYKHNGSFFNEGQPSAETECLAGMQGGYGHFFETDRLRVRHIVCIILPSAKLHHADNCFPQMVVVKR